MRVGKIIKCEKHPNADKLYVEEIDVGEEKPRIVCSGLSQFVSAEKLRNSLVVLLINLESATFRGIASEAMLLCASSDGKVEPLIPPSNSQPGEKITIDGYNGEPVKVITTKDKILKTIKRDFKTNDECVATYKGKPLEVKGKGLVTCLSLKNVYIK